MKKALTSGTYLPLEHILVGLLEQQVGAVIVRLLDADELVIHDMPILTHLLQLDGLVEFGLSMVKELGVPRSIQITSIPYERLRCSRVPTMVYRCLVR